MPSRLTSSRDIRAVFAARNVAHGRALSVWSRVRSEGGPGRATVVAGKRVGGAVQRNRAKRRLRALLRAEPPAAGFDLVLVAAPPAVAVAFRDLVDEHARLRGRVTARLAGARSGPEDLAGRGAADPPPGAIAGRGPKAAEPGGEAAVARGQRPEATATAPAAVGARR